MNIVPGGDLNYGNSYGVKKCLESLESLGLGPIISDQTPIIHVRRL